MVHAILQEFRRYDAMIRKVIDQVDTEQLNRVPVEGGNSIAMLINHLHGNLHSRFTDFLTTDGEKPWREREMEFAPVHWTPGEALARWEAAWTLLESTVSALTEDDLQRSVSIRGIGLTVPEALLRSLAHLSYHAGQMVLLGRMTRASDWNWITIPPGGTAQYNVNPDKEKGLGS